MSLSSQESCLHSSLGKILAAVVRRVVVSLHLWDGRREGRTTDGPRWYGWPSEEEKGDLQPCSLGRSVVEGEGLQQQQPVGLGV